MTRQVAAECFKGRRVLQSAAECRRVPQSAAHWEVFRDLVGDRSNVVLELKTRGQFLAWRFYGIRFRAVSCSPWSMAGGLCRFLRDLGNIPVDAVSMPRWVLGGCHRLCEHPALGHNHGFLQC